jgi:ECF transporter S component (folate family)
LSDNSKPNDGLGSNSDFSPNGKIIKKTDITRIATIALMIALEIVLTRLLTPTLLFIRISFGFLPIALVAIKYGPLHAGTAYMMADLIGFWIFPPPFAFFPGFTLTAFLAGYVYGVFMHNKPGKMLGICISVVFVTIILNLGLDSVWLFILHGEAFAGFLPTRLVRTAIMLPLQIVCISFASKMARTVRFV